mmetsp:Transcript_99860/g.260340  ORF Transcript_99860/g.260340 Transcript_99860/m.260340 type:complete len:274 (-) Transcript_99860:896-1717(-)
MLGMLGEEKHEAAGGGAGVGGGRGAAGRGRRKQGAPPRPREVRRPDLSPNPKCSLSPRPGCRRRNPQPGLRRSPAQARRVRRRGHAAQGRRGHEEAGRVRHGAHGRHSGRRERAQRGAQRQRPGACHACAPRQHGRLPRARRRAEAACRHGLRVPWRRGPDLSGDAAERLLVRQGVDWPRRAHASLQRHVHRDRGHRRAPEVLVRDAAVAVAVQDVEEPVPGLARVAAGRRSLDVGLEHHGALVEGRLVERGLVEGRLVEGGAVEGRLVEARP